MANKKEYNKGYNEAIEYIKKILSGQSNQNSGNGNSQDQDNGLDKDLSGTPAGNTENQSHQQNQSQQQNQLGSQGQSSRGNGSQGKVSASDCTDLTSSPSPGGITNSDIGNKIAKAEGYPEGSSEDGNAKDWKEAANNAEKSIKPGSKAGSLLSKIQILWKTQVDWKKAFRTIVGKSLNTTDKRRAFANKNVLVSQDRVARTDKDKYDNIDYVCVFTDSSGSVSDDDLRYMLGEIYSIIYNIKPETLVLGQFDTSITDIQTFHTPKEFKKYALCATVKGRGGTECKCIWDLLQNDPRFKRSSSEMVIIMTDGYLTTYRRNPKTMQNLCWVILDNPSFNNPNKDPKTSVIHINTSQIKK
jgi:hypothetical protein